MWSVWCLRPPGDFARAVNIERDAKAAIDQSAAMSMHRAYGPVAALSAEERASLAEQLREIREKRKRLDRLGYYWLHGPVTEAL